MKTSRLTLQLMLIVLLSLIQKGEPLNQVVNYNEFTMWMYNYFRAYMCVDMLPDSVCEELAGARDIEEVEEESPVENQIGTSFLPGNENGEEGIFGFGIFGVAGGGGGGGGRRDRRLIRGAKRN